MKKSIFTAVFVLLIVLNSVLVAAKPLGETITGILASVFEIAEYTFGMKFLPDAATNVKVEIITRLSVFLIVLILMVELVEWLGMSPRSAKTIGTALALMSSFAIGAGTLRNIAAVWGGTFAFILYLIPILILGIVLFAIPSNTKTQIIMKIIILFVIISIADSQSEVLETSQTPNRRSLEGSVIPELTGRVVAVPVYYYPPDYQPNSQRGR